MSLAFLCDACGAVLASTNAGPLATDVGRVTVQRGRVHEAPQVTPLQFGDDFVENRQRHFCDWACLRDFAHSRHVEGCADGHT